jgi:transglutaminase-like putative cysteine protease
MAAARRLHVSHETRYDYSSPVASGRHLLHLAPRTLPGQQVIGYHCRIEPAPAEQREGEDFFGNHVTHVAVDDPHERLRITAESVVEVDTRTPDSSAPSPTVAAVRAALAAAGPDARYAVAQYLAPSPLVPLLPEAAAFARRTLAPDRPWPAALFDLACSIHDAFEFDPAATTITTPVREVLARRRGVCQDFAHLLASCLRSSGLPARYVSGYVLTLPPPGQPRLIGADASHAWVAAWSAAGEWVAVDPTNARFVDSDFVTLGWGRDFGDVTPTRGTVLGGGSQELTVRVTVAPEAG